MHRKSKKTRITKEKQKKEKLSTEIPPLFEKEYNVLALKDL